MNVDELACQYANINGECIDSPSTGLTFDALPEVQKPTKAENSDTGVSTNNVLSAKKNSSKSHPQTDNSHWYALRTTYGREKIAYEYIISKGGVTFYPTLTTIKLIDGKRKAVKESRLPNIFFAYGTEEEIKSFVYDNVNLPFLRFYYRHYHFGNKVEKEPLIVPDNQIETLRVICNADADDIIVSIDEVQKFQKGQSVRIVEGKFNGVTGIVACYQGQQRVGIVIDGLLTVATAYIPSAFIKKI